MESKASLFRLIDTTLDIYKKKDLMKHPHPDMPIEMIDETRKPENDWIPWKPISSKVTLKDILELESIIGLQYPDLYKEFLMYKHFYSLSNPKHISFFRHCVRDWKKELLSRYYEYYEPEEIIKKGYIPFADYYDWGMVCFNTNKRRDGSNDCEIVMIDHEQLFDAPVPKEKLYSSFEDLVHDLDSYQNQQIKEYGA